MGKKDRKVKKVVYSPFCDKHQKYTVDLFCVDCDKVICVICQATEEHNSSNHKRILTVEDASAKFAETKEFLDYESKLSFVSKRENEILAENNKVNTITNQLKEETESVIKKHKQDMIDLIEKHYKMLYEKNQLKYEESKKRLQKANEQLYKNKNKTAEISQEIHDKKESGQNVALFIAMKKSQDNLRQIEIEIEETEKLNFVERYEFQAGHMVRQLLEKEKEFGELLVTPSKSPKVPSLELKPPGAFVLPRQSNDMVQKEVADEDEQGDYEYIDEGADDEQFDSRMPQNTAASRNFDKFSNDLNRRFYKDAPPIAKKPSPGTIRRRRKTWHHCNDSDSEQLREIEQTQKPEQEQVAYFDPALHIQSGKDMISTPQQQPGSPILNTERDQAAHSGTVSPAQSGQYIISIPKQQPGYPILNTERDQAAHWGTVSPAQSGQYMISIPKQQPEREQAAHSGPVLFPAQSDQDMISVPKQQPETYIALYDYKPRMDDEIEIKAGHVVTVWEKCDDWFRGVASGRYGLFPQNYVQRVEDSGGAGTHASGGACTDEMTSKILYARRGSQILTTEREQEAHSDPVFPSQSGQDMIPIPQQQPEKYKAVCDYKPKRHDEIEIKAGQVVTVREKCDDWFRGEASGRYGYFPRNCIQKVEDSGGSCTDDSGGACTPELSKILLARRAKLDKS